MRFPSKEVLACIIARAKDPRPWLELPPMCAEEAWKLTEFLDEVQEAIWMDHGDEISDYLDGRDRLDCYHASEDVGESPDAPSPPENPDF